MIEDLEVDPLPIKTLLKSHKIPLWKTAKYLGISYHHASHLLSGRVGLSRKIKPKLDRLMKELEARKPPGA